jgi:hypothetical protein
VDIKNKSIVASEENGKIEIIKVSSQDKDGYRVKVLSSAGVSNWFLMPESELEKKSLVSVQQADMKKIKKYFIKKLEKINTEIIVPIEVLIKGKHLSPISRAELKKVKRKLLIQTILHKINEVKKF